jgi:hypothetical protein
VSHWHLACSDYFWDRVSLFALGWSGPPSSYFTLPTTAEMADTHHHEMGSHELTAILPISACHITGTGSPHCAQLLVEMGSCEFFSPGWFQTKILQISDSLLSS